MERRSGKGTVRGAALVALLATAPALGAQQEVELPDDDRPLDVTLEDVYAVGGAMEDAEWEIFGELGSGSLAFDGSGNLYVFDRENFRVAVVGADGRLVREFGQEGEGPEEWRMPLAMTVMRDGTAVITDMGHRSYLLYGPDGEIEETVGIRLEGGGFSLGTMQPDPRGGHVYSSAGGAFRVNVRTDGGAGEPDEPGRVIERMSLADGVKKPFFTAWQPPPGEQQAQVLRGGGTAFRVGTGGPRTFEPGLQVGVLPDGGLALVDSTTWAVKIVGSDGSLERVIRRSSLSPRPVTGRIEDRERERRLEELEAGEGPRMRIMVQGPGGGASPISDAQIKEMQRSQIEQMRFYPEIPVVDRMAAGWDGKLWVERNPRDWWEEGPVDVVTPEGEYVGTLPADGPGVPAAFGPDGLVAYLQRDEFDVPTIAVKRLPAVLR